ncbi:MAG TPA: LuxR C-terminal-related transcriptional regulator [Acidimicrobiales bacterium]|nr:LuxR C-terminal-related transcriptional regulator [Acidimicrobiales bacterium]
MVEHTGHAGHEPTDAAAPDQGEGPVQLPDDVEMSDVREAVQRCDFPLIIWDATRGVIELANQSAADLVEMPLGDLVGSRLVNLASPREMVERTIDDIESGSFKGLRSERELTLPDKGEIGIQVWTRAIDLAGGPGGVTLIVPDSQIGSLGRDPSKPWRDLVPVAVALIDTGWQIISVSMDIVHLTDQTPTDWVGRSLLDLVQPDDRARLRPDGGPPPDSPTTRSDVHLAHRDGSWVDACLMFSPATDRAKGEYWVGIVGPYAPHDAEDAASARVRELEFRLRRISSEVRAAGLLDNVTALPPPQEYPEVGELTARQWEILSMLVQGQRVSTIAQNLYVSQSTVRNHLATIFKKFGVHSQAELLEKVRSHNPEGTEH